MSPSTAIPKFLMQPKREYDGTVRYNVDCLYVRFKSCISDYKDYIDCIRILKSIARMQSIFAIPRTLQIGTSTYYTNESSR